MDIKNQPHFHVGLLHPRYWLTWSGFGLWWLAAQLPYRAQMVLGRALGWLMYHLLKQRRAIARRNIELCFPEWPSDQRNHLLRENFRATATAVFETGMAWFWPLWRLRKLYRLEGMENLAAHHRGQGAILLSLHFTTLELLGAALTPRMDAMAMSYRPHRNPVYDLVQHWARGRRNASATVIAAGEVRGMVRLLRQGYAVGYLPDQDYGPKHSVFAPFFGVPAATVTSLSRLAKMARVPVVPLFNYRRHDGKGYVFEVLPPLENFPSGDEALDARRINAHVEECVRRYPEQYLWAHRRFKTRPPGEEDVYGLPRRRSRRRRTRA